MVIAEGMACPMPGKSKSKVIPAPWPMPSKETLRRLEDFGYDYLYVGQGMYRVWERRAHTHIYLDNAGIDELIQKWERKRERALRKKEKQEKKADGTKGKTTSKRRRRSTGLRRDKSKGKSRG